MKNQFSREEAGQQVVLMAKRTALLYQTFAEILMEELGEEKGMEAVARVVKAYGTKCGSMVRKGVEAKGLALSLPNYFSVPDLPKVGWVTDQKTLKEDELEVDILYCPMAEQWQEEGKDELGRLYCWVDQAKFAAYDPDLECTHVKNVFDGDKKCTLSVRKKKQQ